MNAVKTKSYIYIVVQTAHYYVVIYGIRPFVQCLMHEHLFTVSNLRSCGSRRCKNRISGYQTITLYTYFPQTHIPISNTPTHTTSVSHPTHIQSSESFPSNGLRSTSAKANQHRTKKPQARPLLFGLVGCNVVVTWPKPTLTPLLMYPSCETYHFRFHLPHESHPPPGSYGSNPSVRIKATSIYKGCHKTTAQSMRTGAIYALMCCLLYYISI